MVKSSNEKTLKGVAEVGEQLFEGDIMESGKSLHKIVSLDQGAVKGEKYWNGDYYEFYGIPYASVPKGKDRFQSPLPPKSWDGIKEATAKDIKCPQVYYTGNDDDLVIGEEECLVLNIFAPTIANEDHRLPVLVYIHSGAFAIGDGNVAGFQFLVRHDVIVISLNYRLGAIGFACLGTKEIPGNAGLKDQVAALRWIKNNIAKFGGDPNKITVAGYSVGAAMAELLALSKTTTGIIDKIILESGSALSPWVINVDPVNTAYYTAKSVGFNGTKNTKDLTEFYLKSKPEVLATKSLNFFLKNGTFGFSPCVENNFEDTEAFLTESPFDILSKGDFHDVAVITGFADSEGLSRIKYFDTWFGDMKSNLEEFLPVDIQFKDDKSRKEVVNEIEEKYFNKNAELSLKSYVDYSSDLLFKYGIMKSATLHAEINKRPIYLYEFSYVGDLSFKYDYMEKIKGASHRDQTSYILDFHGYPRKHEDLDMRDIMTMMWTDFVKFENPTEYESCLINFKWHPYKLKEPYFLKINKTSQIQRNLFNEEYQFWNGLYAKYYRNPTPPISSRK